MKNELIVFYNNDLELYDTDGRLIQSKELDQGVTHAVQDEDCVLFNYDNGTLACYDWEKDKIIDEYENFGSVKSLSISSYKKLLSKDMILVAGGDDGELVMFK